MTTPKIESEDRMNKVYAVRCSGYSEVDERMNALFELMGGIGKFLVPGEKVVLKVNLLAATKPEKTVTTHPTVVASVARMAKGLGAIPVIAEIDESLGLEGRIKQVSGPCFVATAAYGSSMEPRVDTLRTFRDELLEKTEWGRSFVEFYYNHGQGPAAWIEEHAWAKALVRVLLLPLVGVAKFLLWVI